MCSPNRHSTSALKQYSVSKCHTTLMLEKNKEIIIKKKFYINDIMQICKNAVHGDTLFLICCLKFRKVNVQYHSFFFFPHSAHFQSLRGAHKIFSFKKLIKSCSNGPHLPCLYSDSNWSLKIGLT